MGTLRLLNNNYYLAMDGSGGLGDTVYTVTNFSSKQVIITSGNYKVVYSGTFKAIQSPVGLTVDELSTIGASGTVNGLTCYVGAAKILSYSGFQADVAGLLADASTTIAYLLSGNDSVVGGTYNDILYGFNGNDKLDGGAGNDQLFGGAGNDTLLGGAGSDKLMGGEGSDTIITGSGADTVVIAFTNTQTTIADYNTTQDKLDLSEFGITNSSLITNLAKYLTITQIAKDTVITGVSDDIHIKLTGVSAKTIDYTDFI